MTMSSVLASMIFVALTALSVAAPAPAITASYVVTNLGTLGGPSSTPTAINDVGQVVGSSETSDGATHAFLWQNGALTDLGTLAGAGFSSYATGINNLGQVVGYSTTVGDPNYRAFLWQSGTMTDLNSLIPADSGWVLRNAAAINEAGQIVGWGMLSGQQRAFL